MAVIYLCFQESHYIYIDTVPSTIDGFVTLFHKLRIGDDAEAMPLSSTSLFACLRMLK